MRVAAAAGGAALLDVVVAGVLGGGDVTAGVAVAAAGVVAGAFEALGGGEGGLDEKKGREGEVLGELHFGWGLLIAQACLFMY